MRVMPHALTALLFAASVAASAAQTTPPTDALVESFKRESVFWPQFTIAVRIAERNDPRVLPALASWLGHEDRHLRGNAAFIFARLGDPRGFQTIAAILADRSARPQGQGIPGAPGDGRYRVAQQIAADRYYAAHLLGDLEDPQAVALLVPLLKDREVQSIVPWSLAQIGDKGAVGPLLEVLDADDPSMRVLAIYALETLRASEAVPRLTALLDDHRRSNFGGQVSVADAAKRALAKLK
jgi:HEAT repeat protein